MQEKNFKNACTYRNMYTDIYTGNIKSTSVDNRCGLFAYRIYKEFHINLWECLMYGY